MDGPEQNVDDELLEKMHDEFTDGKEVKLTESGQEQVSELLRENDEEVLQSVRVGVEDFDLQEDRAQFTTRLTQVAQYMRDDVGVNVFRVLDRNPKAAADLGLGDISQELIGQFEPETNANDEKSP